jgi:hypothetical protein
MAKLSTIFVLTIILATGAYSAANPDSASRANIALHAVRLTEPIVLDGKLTESIWINDEGFSDFVERDPVEWSTPSEKTLVHVAYDNAALYVGAMMYDSHPDSIVARLARKDSETGSDKLGLFLDPYHDKRSGYEFFVDASGGVIDGTLYNDEFDSYTWDGIWEAEVSRDNQGWSVEIRIPFSQLHFKQADVQVWGIDFKRTIARKNETSYITFTPKKSSGFVSRFVPLIGIENISPSRQIELLPYVTTQAQYLQHSPGDPFNTGKKYLPATGVDLKMGLGSNMTLNATINPDFGQVEVDPAVVNLSDVETIYQEKRPFFVEGNDIFDFGYGGARNFWGFNWPGPDFLYTRRIGKAPSGSIPSSDYYDVPTATHILGAAKLTGKLEDWNIGTIHALTKREMTSIQTSGIQSETEIEPLAYYGVVRAQKEIDGGKQGIGILSTLTERSFQDNRLRDQMNSSGAVAALDGWTFLDEEKEWVLTGWGAVSRVAGNNTRMVALQRNSQHYFQRPDAPEVEVDSSAMSMTGYAARVYLNKQKGSVFTNSAIGVLSPKFDIGDLGFVSRTNVVNMHTGGGYKWTGTNNWYSQISALGALFRSYDFAGNIIWEGLYQEVDFQTPDNYYFNYSIAYNPQTVNNRRTRGGPLSLNPPGFELSVYGETNNNASWVLSCGAYDYFPSYSNSTSVWANLTYRPASNISITVGPEVDRERQSSQWVGAFSDPLAVSTYGSRYVFGEMDQTTFYASIRLNWTFNPKLSLQIYVQPLISAGSFSSFKELAAPKTYDFNRYADNNVTLSNGSYTVDPDGSGGPAPSFNFSNPDFNIRSVRGNAVLRWEYLPGSIMYLVWTQSRSDYEDNGEFQFNRSFSHLLDITPDNIFMVKFSYWWSL